MKLSQSIIIGAVMCAVPAASAETVTSPDGNLKVDIALQGGVPVYTVTLEGDTMVATSPLGFRSNEGDFSSAMKMGGSRRGRASRSYTNGRIKKSHIDYNANTLQVDFTNPDGNMMTVECNVSDNNIGLRYRIPRMKGGETGSLVISGEATGYAFPEGTTAFLTPQSDPMIGWKRTKPSYEELYVLDAPLDSASQYGRGYTFPALFRVGDRGWVFLTETGVDGYYCGSHLSDFSDGRYTIAYPMPEENNGNGTAAPGIALPGTTPWRTLTVARTPAPIVETTVMYDLVEPRYQPARPAKTGRGTWSWILWQDGSINFDDQKKFIDLAAEMGYDHALIDNWWNTNIGRDRMRELARYAQSKGVNIAVWYSSSGHWNDIVQGPVNIMDRPITRKKEMAWLRDLGVNTIKVDFFGGDKQETMRLYEDILSDAADYGIDVIFHGCTMPRGWEEMYPNFVGAEAVLASENLIFEQRFCDREAMTGALHPFVRNAGGLMEYGGTFLNRRMHKSNEKGNTRLTGDGFQLATAVLFQNPVQNFALAPNNLTDAPAESIEFMKRVPATWDDTRFIEGYPGRYVVLMRRHGNEEYYAAVNAEPQARKITVPALGKKGDTAVLYFDKSVDRIEKKTVRIDKPVTVTLPYGCGFVLVRE